MAEDHVNRQVGIEEELVELISTWEPKYLFTTDITQKILEEISFCELDSQKQRDVMDYVGNNIQRLLELVTNRRAEIAAKNVVR